jgi:hypothetical protein
MLARFFQDSKGSLFEATDVDFVNNLVSRYELENGPDDRALISGLADALTIANPDAALAAAADYIDLDHFRRFWAMTSLVAQFDSFPYSIPGDDYFLYADPTSRKLYFMPWGMDETFYSAEYDVRQIHSVLATKCMDSPTCFQAYANEVWDMLAMTDEMGLAAERERMIAEIAPYVAQDTRKSYTVTEVNTSQQALYWFIKERRMRLSAMIPAASN